MGMYRDTYPFSGAAFVFSNLRSASIKPLAHKNGIDISVHCWGNQKGLTPRCAIASHAVAPR